MTPANALIPDAPEARAAGGRAPTGILPCQVLRELIRAHEIQAANEIHPRQIQPASLDLRLGRVAYRVRASFLPGTGSTVHEKLALFGMHEIDLAQGAVLERGCVYVVPLQEHLRLSPALSGIANPKSSTGRLDIFTRLITDRAAEFERVPEGYEGPLFAEISPRTFSIVVRQGSRLNQLRIRRRAPALTAQALLRLHEREALVDRVLDARALAQGLPLSVDLEGDPVTGFVGWRAKKHTGLVDVDKIGQYDPMEYWEPIHRSRDRRIVLDPDDFYILASKEHVSIPPDHAAEMVAIDPLVGEFRVHYAGFFDPGFGHAAAGGAGTRAVLEVRSHEVPFMLEDGQLVGRLSYERLTDLPDRLYGQGIGSSYQKQGLQLSKQFRVVE